MPSCDGRHLPLNNTGYGALRWHAEVQTPISNEAENPCIQIAKEVGVREGENPQGCNDPCLCLRNQWPALSFGWRCLAADLSTQRCPQAASQQGGTNLHTSAFPGVFLPACLAPGGPRCWVPPSLHAPNTQQVTRREATDAGRQQRARRYGAAVLSHALKPDAR